MKYLFLLVLTISLYTPYATANTHELSEPLDITKEGWYKVLQMSNGNTMLFVFELRKAIEVKIFDKDRKEIASNRSIGKVISMSDLERSDLHGIYEINGDGVIFISQTINTLPTLVAMRFSAETGKLIKEEKLLESESYKKRNEYHVVRASSGNGYAVFCMKNIEANFKEPIFLQRFDEEHHATATIQIDDDRENYDYVNHIGTTIDEEDGIIVALNCRTIIHHPDVIQSNLLLCYLAPGSTTFSQVLTKMPVEYGPYFTTHSYNDFGKKINFFLTNAMKGTFNNGVSEYERLFFNTNMMMYDVANLGNMNHGYIIHRKANELLQEHTDTNHVTDPIPMRIYTNKFGSNTIVSEEIEQNYLYKNINTGGTLLGSITVTLVNDRGSETWSTIIPKSQVLANLLTPYEVHERGKRKQLFRQYDTYTDWLYQFASFNSYVTEKGDCYIIYNDLKSNFERGIGDNIDTSSTFGNDNHIMNTDAICYKVGKRKTVEKSLLIENPEGNHAVFVESADFSNQTNTYAALIAQGPGKDYKFRVVWKKLEDE